MNRFAQLTSLAVALVLAYSIQASEETIGPKGINSIATGLDGMNSIIGQVEGARPGVSGYDTAANCCNDKVVPVLVYNQSAQAGVNQGLDDHPIWVASVMISKQDFLGGGQSIPLGVAPEALLTSAAYLQPFPVNLQQDAALAAQSISPFVYATNMSFGVDLDDTQLDGTSTLTSFVDWSTVSHEVLYIVAGNEISKPDPVPTDNFNGITVAAAGRADDGVFRVVSNLNVYDEALDAVGPRTSTLILAPGALIDVAGANHSQPSRIDSSGTSMAAPHVTGTLALLEQQADNMSSINGNRHLTKKAVILNSADKIKGIIGMERTVIKSNKGNWFGTDAHNDPAIPVDREMGVGHLNAKRAVEQLAAGEQGLGGVQLKGWDYATAIDPFIPNTYTLSLNAGDYVSATLVWDRDVFLNSPFTTYERGDEFVDFGFANLDLYLVPAGQGIGQAVASSTSTAWNIEHIFAKVETAGAYELWVTQSELNETFYAVAWWAGADGRGAPGDFNSDGTVNGADYVVWRKSDGSTEGYAEWRSNFGNSSGSSSLASVPEPSAICLALVGMLFCAATRRSA